MGIRARGFSRFELMVSVAIVALFCGVLLDRLLYYEGQTERTVFDLTLHQLRSGLRLRVANLMVNGQPVDYERIARENPMDWLAVKPKGYRAAAAGLEGGDLARGEWSYDPRRRLILYRPRLKAEFDGMLDPQGRARAGLFLVYNGAGGLPQGLEIRVIRVRHESLKNSG